MDERDKESLPQGTINVSFEDKDAFTTSLHQLQQPSYFLPSSLTWELSSLGSETVVAEGQPGGIIKRIRTTIVIPFINGGISLCTVFEKEDPIPPLDFDEEILRESLADLPYRIELKTRSRFGYEAKDINFYSDDDLKLGFISTCFSQQLLAPKVEQLLSIFNFFGSHTGFEVVDLDHWARILEGLLKAIYLKNEGVIPNFEYVIKTSELVSITFPAIYPQERVRQRGELSFDDIGGQDEAVEKMKQVVNQINHPEVFRQWGAPPPKGVLLVGPPGNGKTLMGRVVAHESDAYFNPLNLADLLTRWVGETEQQIKRHFEEAKEREEKTIIFLDEVDGIGKTRKKMTQEHSANFLLTLTQEWDGIVENPNVLVIGTTNNLEDVDPALLREDRFDIIVYMNNPDTPKKITDVLNIHAQKAEDLAERQLFTEVELSKVAVEIEKKFGQGNSSCARISEILQRVLRNKANEELETGLEPPSVTIDDFKKVIEKYEERE